MIAAELETVRHFVGIWRVNVGEGRRRFIERDAVRIGCKPSWKVVKRILEETTQEKPARATDRGVRILAQLLGVSGVAVLRVRREYNLSTDREGAFKVTNGIRIDEILRDVAALYLSTLEDAIVLSVDEKSEIKSLYRVRRSCGFCAGSCRQ